MADQANPTPDASQVETPQVSEQEAPVVEDVQEPEEVAAQPTEPVVEQQQTQDRRPTRAEKRLHDLLNKGKQPQESYVDIMARMPEVAPSEDGTFTPEQLQQYIAQETAKTVKMHEEQQQYVRQVEAFTSEVEEVGGQIDEDFKDNPKVAEEISRILSRTLQAANTRQDPRGNEYLVPVLSPKEAYNDIKKALELTTTQGKAKATAVLAQQIAEGAVTPSTREPSEENFTQLTAAEIFKNPTAIREALEKKLSKAS